MIRVVAFDLDDTLWHVDPVIIRAEQKLNDWFASEVPELKYDMPAMRELRHEVLAEHPDILGRLTEFRSRLIEKAMLKSGIHADDARLHTGTAMEVFLTARNEVSFFAGAIEAIARMASSYQLGALTNGNADIHRLGLGEHFGFAFSAEEIGAPKPDPGLFHAALNHTGCAPAEMIYVGDDPVKDIDAAKSVGLQTIWLRNERRPGPAETEPDRIINDIRELPAAVESLNTQ